MKKIATAILCLSLLLAGCGTKADSEEVKYYKTETLRTFFGTSTSREVNEYDEQWNLIHVTTYQDGAEVSQVDFEYTDTGFRMVGVQDGVEEILEFIITKDEQGNPLRTEQYLNGELYNVSDCTYDTNGNLLTQTSTIPAANITVSLKMEYDENGNRIKTTQDNGYDMGTTTYTYGEDGKLLTETYHSKSGGMISFKEYSYSSNGLRESVLTYEDENIYTGRQVTTYDEAGNILLTETFDGADQLLSTIAYSYIGTDGSISSGIESEE